MGKLTICLEDMLDALDYYDDMEKYGSYLDSRNGEIFHVYDKDMVNNDRIFRITHLQYKQSITYI